MSPVNLIRSVVRHWVALAVVAVVTASTACGFWMSSPPSYDTSSSFLVLAPAAEISSELSNPLTGSSFEANAVLAEALALRVNGADGRTEIERLGLSSDYELAPSDLGSPILHLRVSAADSTVAGAAADALTRLVDEGLSATQDDLGVALSVRFELRTLDVGAPVANHEARNRLVALTLAIGLLAAPALGITLDSMAKSVQERRRRSIHPSLTGRERAASAVTVRSSVAIARGP